MRIQLSDRGRSVVLAARQAPPTTTPQKAGNRKAAVRKTTGRTTDTETPAVRKAPATRKPPVPAVAATGPAPVAAVEAWGNPGQWQQMNLLTGEVVYGTMGSRTEVNATVKALGGVPASPKGWTTTSIALDATLMRELMRHVARLSPETGRPALAVWEAARVVERHRRGR